MSHECYAREFTLIGLTLLVAGSVFGVDGTVINQTTGKPQGGVIVSLIQPGQGGMQTLGSGKTDGAGKFQIAKSGDGGGPVLVQALYAGVPYNKMLAPGTPTSGVEVAVYDAAAILLMSARRIRPRSNVVYGMPRVTRASLAARKF